MTAAPESLPGTPGVPRTAIDAFDVLSDLLRVVRLTGAVLFRGDLSAPWAFETLDSTQLAAMLLRRVRTLAGERSRATDREGALTAREREILALLEQGLTNKQIARELRIELATVKNHVHNILDKLGVPTRGAAAARART